MAHSGRMPLSIDVAKYMRLPPDVRARFDGWLRTETPDGESLDKKRIVNLTLGEGEIIVEQVQRDENGEIVFDRAKQEVVHEIARYPVRSLPPQDAFA